MASPRAAFTLLDAAFSLLLAGFAVGLVTRPSRVREALALEVEHEHLSAALATFRELHGAWPEGGTHWCEDLLVEGLLDGLPCHGEHDLVPQVKLPFGCGTERETFVLVSRGPNSLRHTRLGSD